MGNEQVIALLHQILAQLQKLDSRMKNMEYTISKIGHIEGTLDDLKREISRKS
jgi:prefoldin subunit 5